MAKPSLARSPAAAIAKQAGSPNGGSSGEPGAPAGAKREDTRPFLLTRQAPDAPCIELVQPRRPAGASSASGVHATDAVLVRAPSPFHESDDGDLLADYVDTPARRIGRLISRLGRR